MLLEGCKAVGEMPASSPLHAMAVVDFFYFLENIISCIQEGDQEWMHTIEEKKVTLNSTVRFQVFNMSLSSVIGMVLTTRSRMAKGGAALAKLEDGQV